jgi:hypothetical protein
MHMKKIIIVSVIALYLPMLPAASETLSFQVIPDHTYPVTALKKEDHAAWVEAYTAIDEDNYDRFAAALTARLVNKASHIPHSASSIAHVKTLPEYLVQQKSSEHRTKMIEQLLYHGTHTRSTYGVGIEGQAHIYDDHLPPIYYAIIAGNIEAFEVLIKRDYKVPMQSAIDIWGKGDDPSEKPSVGMLLKRLVYLNELKLARPKKITLPKPLPDNKILAYMITLDRRAKEANGSCIIE